MKKIVLSLIIVSMALCGSAVSADEKSEQCFFIRNNSGELIEICEDKLPNPSPKGNVDHCKGMCW